MITEEEFKEHGFSVKDIYSDNIIELDWYRPDQNWRSFRLHRVVGYLRAMADCTGNFGVLRKLARIQDHKGTLFAYWHQLPTDAEKAVLEKAWDSECEDGVFIEHEMEEINDQSGAIQNNH